MNDMIETFHQLPITVQKALICASELSELEFHQLYKLVYPKTEDWVSQVSDEYPIVAIEPEAFIWGAKLRSAMQMVFSADHAREYEEDIKTYNKVVSELNEKYGVIALSSEFAETRTGYGLAAHPLGIVSPSD
jgi:hypothetical protein